MLLISLALCADAVIGNVQEKAMKQFSASNVEVVLFSYAIGLVYIFAGLALTGGLVPAFHYCLQVCWSDVWGRGGGGLKFDIW